MGTLHPYIVIYKHVAIVTNLSTLEELIVPLTCKDAAKALKLYCQEYRFCDKKVFSKQATDLTKLTHEELKDLIISAYWLTLANGLIGKFWNKMFRATDIRDDMILHNSKSTTEVGGITETINKLMERQEENSTGAKKRLQR